MRRRAHPKAHSLIFLRRLPRRDRRRAEQAERALSGKPMAHGGHPVMFETEACVSFLAAVWQRACGKERAHRILVGPGTAASQSFGVPVGWCRVAAAGGGTIIKQYA